VSKGKKGLPAEMLTDRNNESGVQCPVCQFPLQSEPHNSRCGKKAAEEITEVRPPETAKPELRSHGQSVEAEFFPLVSAAHEFKTPLVVMMGYTDLLRNSHLGPVNDRQRQVLGEIQESAERLQKLIQNLLLLSELRAGKGAGYVEPECEPANVNEHLREIFNVWSSAARQKSINYVFRAAEGSPKVAVDSLKLQHIISNLIENALKYTPNNGRVTLSAMQGFWERRKAQSEFLFNMERKENRKVKNAVRIDVTDTGPGVPLERQRDIFQDFVQLPGTSSRGTGLGLAIARRMVEAHGGVIWVESELGKGSKFSLLLSQVR
jgi:signal transduction histidine kinase